MISTLISKALGICSIFPKFFKYSEKYMVKRIYIKYNKSITLIKKVV